MRSMTEIEANVKAMSPQLRTECDEVFDYWRREGLQETALAYCVIADDETKSSLLRQAAAKKFEEMYDATVKALGLTPVMSEAKPQYIWRNGARVRV